METKRRMPDKDVQHLLRNALSDKSVKEESEHEKSVWD